jgi:teichuronic acid biosynthesis glycosyltransferase TuaH
VKIVFASHTAATGVFRVGSHHLSRELAVMGHDVSHVSTPVSLGHIARLRNHDVRARFLRAMQSPVVDADGVTHVVPIVFVPLSAATTRVASWQLRWPVKRWSSALGNADAPDILFIDQPLLADLVGVLKPKRVIYRPTDAHFDPVSRAAERRLLTVADAVVATSQHVLELVLQDSQRTLPTFVLENGVEYDRFFGSPTANVRDGVAYLGALDRRFDWEILKSLARAYPMEKFRIAGPLPSTRPEVPSNVDLMGPVPYHDAPKLLQRSKVGLLPMSSDPGNEGRSPMKYYEYLASGLAVVASSSETLKRRSAPGVWLYDRAETAIYAMGEALAMTRESSAEGALYAKKFGWASRADELMHFVGQLP